MHVITYSRFEAAMDMLGFSDLRPQQVEPVESAAQGNDTFVNLPTGSGKSAIFQLPAASYGPGGLSLNISPLKALQEDQVKKLRKKGIPVYLLNSDLSQAKRKKVLGKAVTQGGLLYLAPEQLRNKEVRQTLLTADIALIAVDEAHILAHTQDDFRTAYGEIGDFIAGLPMRPTILAMTATCTRADRKVIVDSLGMKDVNKFIAPMRRDNLGLSVKLITTTANKREELEINRFNAVERELAAWDDKGSAIVYCPTVKMVKKLYRWLKARDYRVGIYHGKMKRKKRKKEQRRFMSGKHSVMVATNAFGLGIDKPDVRLIIHAGLPLSLDGYVQEIGRAGRDGKKSRCVLFYSKSDFSVNERILKHSSSAETKYLKLRRLQALCELLKSHKCLWHEMEKYFGQKPKENCGKCCNCQRKQ